MKKTLYLTIISILVLVLCATAFAACKNKNKEPEHLKPVDGATITYDGDVLEWGAVDHAEGYYVYLNDSTEYYATEEAKMSLRLSEDVTFSILSVANNADYISAESKGSASFTYVPMVESIGVRKRTTDKLVGQDVTANDTSFDYFTWEAVASADYYLLKENGETETRSFQPDVNEGVLVQPIGADFDGDGGVASLSVKPQSEKPNTYSHWSDEKTVTVLADPTNFGYNSDNSRISWKNVSNATVYEVKVGQDLDAIEEWKAVTNNFYVYGENVSSFKMGVKAIGNYDNDVLDSRLVTRGFQQLPALQGIAVNFGELVWNPVATVGEYQVRISVNKADGDRVYAENLVDTVVTGSSFIGTYEALLDQETIGSSVVYRPSTYTAYVRPIIASSEAEDVVTFANWTKAEFSLLQTPTLTYSGNEAFTWDSIPGAAGYNIWLYRNGVNVHNKTYTEDNELRFQYNFSKNSGTYELRIAALAGVDNNASGNNGSRKSDAFTIIVISAPTEYTLMSSDYDIETDASQTPDNYSELNFFFNDVYGADYYVASHFYDYKYVDGDGDGNIDIEVDSQDASTKLARQTINAVNTVGENAAKGKYNVNVNSVIADETGRTDTVYLYAKSSLATYTQVDEHGETVEYITYVEKYKISDNTYGFRKAVDDEGKPVVSNMLIMNGDDSTPIEITKLATPQKVTLKGTSITWDKVSRASGYQVKIICKDHPERNFVADVYANHYDLALYQEGEYEIYVRTKGNGNVLLNSVFGSPLTLIKLPAVEDVRVENQGGNTVLAWGTSKFTYGDVDYFAQRYEVRVGNYLLYNDNANFFNLEGQKQFFSSEGSACTVTAISNNYEISDHAFVLSAEKSKTINIFKLGVPQNLTMQSNILTWSYDGNAKGFKVYDGNTEVARTTATQLAITAENGFVQSIYSGKQCLFRVVAVMDITNGSSDTNPYKMAGNSNAYYVDSEESVQLSINMLSTPDVKVAKNTGAATWDKVVGATSYLVKVKDITTGAEMNYNVSDYSNANSISFVPTVLTGDGSSVRISVTAIGNNIKYFNSFPFSYVTSVEKLGALKKKDGKTFEIKVNYNELTGVATSFTVHVFDADEPAGTRTKGRGYIVNIGGLEHFTADGDYTVENLNAGNYVINVCAAGNNYEGEVNVDGDDNLLYINGDYEEGLERSIYVLGAPIADEVSVSYGGLGDLTKRLVYFAAVPNAKGYKLTYKYQKLETSGEYVDIEDANGKIEFNVGANTTKGYVEKQFDDDEIGRVCFVLEGIDADVDLAVITVQVLGDGINSVSNTQTTVSYVVR